MSGFVTSGLAWAALALASIPIIIHLLNRRKLLRMDWAAMEFLLAALKRTRRKLRLEHLLLLLIRTLMMILLGLFLARPMLSDTEYSWLAGALKNEEKIFILDDSLSMNRQQAGGTTFARGRGALVAELERLGSISSPDTALVLRASRPRAGIRGNFSDTESSQRLIKSVEMLQPTSTRMNLSATLDNIAEAGLASDSSVARPRSLSIITDLRSTDWTDGSGGPEESLKKALERLISSSENPPKITIYDVGSPDTSNLAITAINVTGGRPATGIPTEIRLEIENFSDEPARNLRAQLTFGPLSGKRTTAATAVAQPVSLIEGKSSGIATITSTFRSPGKYWAEAQLMGVKDPLPEDNRYSFVIDVVESTEVLLVNGEPSAEPWEGETDFIANALSPGAESSFGILPVVVTENSLPEKSLEQYNVVFLANTYSRLPEEFLLNLARFVRSGSTLIIFTGDQTDAAVYSSQLGLNTEGKPQPWNGMLPAAIGKVLTTQEKGWKLEPEFNNPYFRLLEGEAEPYLAQVMFRSFWQLAPEPGARVLARFSDPDSSPAIVEKPFGEGRVLLVATSADDEWHDWPRNATYPILLRQIIDSVGKEKGRQPEFLAGQAIDFPIDVSEFRTEAAYLAVDERSEGSLTAAPTQNAEDQEEEFRFLLDKRFTLKTGLFRIGLDPIGGGERQWRAMAIRSDPEESDFSYLSAGQLESLYPGIDLEVVREFAGSGRGHFEISDLLLLAFILFLFLEGFLACRFARHREGRTG